MSNWRINKWVHCYDFQYSDFLYNHLGEIIEKYKKEREKDYNGEDRQLNIEKINEFLYPQIYKLIEDNFYVGKRYENFPIFTYVQTPSDQTHIPDFHTHTHNPGNLCGVFYLNIPQQGGELQITYPPFFENFLIKPQLNKVYLFPVWLMHRALPHSGDKERISFNFTYPGNIRPIHKFTGDIW